MSEDKFLDLLGQASKNLTGSERSVETVVADFSLYGAGKRVEALEQIDHHIRNIDEVGRGESALREHAKLMRLRRDLDKVHHTLRRVGR